MSIPIVGLNRMSVPICPDVFKPDDTILNSIYGAPISNDLVYKLLRALREENVFRQLRVTCSYFFNGGMSTYTSIFKRRSIYLNESGLGKFRSAYCRLLGYETQLRVSWGSGLPGINVQLYRLKNLTFYCSIDGYFTMEDQLHSYATLPPGRVHLGDFFGVPLCCTPTLQATMTIEEVD